MKHILLTILTIIAVMASSNDARAEEEIPLWQVSENDVTPAESASFLLSQSYEICLKQMQVITNQYSKCAGQLIERGTLPEGFVNFPVEIWSFSAVITRWPRDPGQAQALVDACNRHRVYVQNHYAACKAGL